MVDVLRCDTTLGVKLGGMKFFLATLCAFTWLIQSVEGHGRVIEPPARNVLWRFGYDAPQNFEDSELFCGGIKAQWQDNDGRCGVCGDNYSLKPPRRHETGREFARNFTVRTYAPGSQIEIVIDIVANHLGYFEFSLCPRNDSGVLETEECFDSHPLPVFGKGMELSEGKSRYRLPTARKGLYLTQVQLPPDIVCEFCVLRWHWRSANNWGLCEDGKEAMGCGPQETYRNCVDIAVGHNHGIRGSLGANAKPRPKEFKFPKNKPYVAISNSVVDEKKQESSHYEAPDVHDWLLEHR
ncbi:uncharacterized protein LOC135398715 [Ornithodoros turicata]|uniref:uncharacterized protein LOC135398715 n=1 Tax=Ornithodoros turicata TaxID=34597 RepID=UPI0031399702